MKKALLGLFWSIVFIFLGVLLDAWVVMLLWGWFIVPVFNLPALGYLQAMGVSLVIGYLTFQSPADEKKKDGPNLKDQTIHWLTYDVYVRLFCLFIGWIVHFFL